MQRAQDWASEPWVFLSQNHGFQEGQVPVDHQKGENRRHLLMAGAPVPLGIAVVGACKEVQFHYVFSW